MHTRPNYIYNFDKCNVNVTIIKTAKKKPSPASYPAAGSMAKPWNCCRNATQCHQGALPFLAAARAIWPEVRTCHFTEQKRWFWRTEMWISPTKIKPNMGLSPPNSGNWTVLKSGDSTIFHIFRRRKWFLWGFPPIAPASIDLPCISTRVSAARRQQPALLQQSTSAAQLSWPLPGVPGTGTAAISKRCTPWGQWEPKSPGTGVGTQTWRWVQTSGSKILGLSNW